MALSTITKLFGIDDLKIYPVTEDTPTAYTVGAGIDIPGVKELSMDFEIEEKELTGDESILDLRSKIKKITFSASYAKIELAALPTLIGGRVVATGETRQTYSLQDGDLPGYFQLAALIRDVDAGGVRIHLMKCKLSAHNLGGKEEDYNTFSISGSAIKTNKPFTRGTNNKGLIYDFIIDSEETELVAIAA